MELKVDLAGEQLSKNCKMAEERWKLVVKVEKLTELRWMLVVKIEELVY